MNLHKLTARRCNSLLQKVRDILKSPSTGKEEQLRGTEFSCSIPPARGREHQGTPWWQSKKQVKQLSPASGLATPKCKAWSRSIFETRFSSYLLFIRHDGKGTCSSLWSRDWPTPSLNTLHEPRPCRAHHRVSDPRHRSKKKHYGCKKITCWEVSLCHI